MKCSWRHTARCLVVLALCPLSACQAGAERQPPPNVLLVVVDTLRTDRLGAYGNGEQLTPFLDSLADRAFVFRNAYAQSSWTYPSVASILTSRFPAQHGVLYWATTLRNDEIVLPEVLRGHGYATAAFQANTMVSPGKGFGQGFDDYRTYALRGGRQQKLANRFHERANTLNADAMEWITHHQGTMGQAAPLFVYMQYMEPHFPWEPSEAALDHVVKTRSRPVVADVNSRFIVARRDPLPPDVWDAVGDVYDAAVVTLDRELRHFFAELEKCGFLNNALVVITADHGEELGEHRLAGHGISLYNEETHVPLIVVPPWPQKRLDVSDVVSLIDIAPTILELAGVPRPSSFEGQTFSTVRVRGNPATIAATLKNFLGLRDTTVSVSRGAYSSLAPQHGEEKDVPAYNRIVHKEALVLGVEKVVRSAADVLTVYRLDEDPHEANPRVVGSDRADLRQAITEARERAGANVAIQKTQPVSEEMQERLRALGYVQ